MSYIKLKTSQKPSAMDKLSFSRAAKTGVLICTSTRRYIKFGLNCRLCGIWKLTMGKRRRSGYFKEIGSWNGHITKFFSIDVPLVLRYHEQRKYIMVPKMFSNFQIKHNKCRYSKLQEENSNWVISHIENTIQHSPG